MTNRRRRATLTPLSPSPHFGLPVLQRTDPVAEVEVVRIVGVVAPPLKLAIRHSPSRRAGRRAIFVNELDLVRRPARPRVG